MTSLIKQWNEAIANNYGAPPLGLVSGAGSTVVDEEGKSYIDMLAGIAVNSLGYGHPAVVQAVSQQVAKLAHVSNLFASDPVVEVAQKLKARVGDSDARVFFCNSGTEANEAAFKVARLTGKKRVLAAHHGFHGRTMGALAMTGQPGKRAPFEPLPAGVEFYPYGDIEYLRTLVEQDPANTAAIILEPIQGETGVIPAPDGFLVKVRQLCDEYELLLIVDEVQTGVGRTGDFFAFQSARILPDVITMAKGLGAGLPIGATIVRGAAKDLLTPGSHGTTFGGNPVVCAAANAVLDTIDAAFIAEVRNKGERLAERVAALPGVVEVRGRGLMLGVVLERPVAKQVVSAGFKHGVIVNAPNDSVVRLTPPLVIEEAELDAAVNRFALALSDATVS
ncbi:acetylornithine transaminase [Corynebacterium striatum]|uniref:Acetylornithine aminotransferase n=1 Tax=Corynebacterium striatum TaxID=43770 RepID=A0ABC8CHN7_CORST|nr:acetylornithine transaminase [Corynebacterium striatum]ATZ07929.1 acetylornithine transaminase [Corynebacterium striatum]EGT5591706.1 acetylornithine transaminase [Corynebacterium striatum]EGT5612063.1 acetylornithine transaminase [Corynebacterium striatum]MDK8788492.1 acetylornithine transaminase [Corynebacterium striatum]NHY10478.1 acetylornithine transaminase [Corynebacterium striatum]